MEERERDDHLRILFEHYLSYKRVDLVLNSNKEVDSSVVDSILFAIEQLKTKKPIDYIINETEFLGYPLYVDEGVLIPRSETEELVMLILEKETDEGIEILDIGTGSGCIPIGLALEREYKKIAACELSLDALAVAKQNGLNYNLDIDFYQLDILKETPNKKFDVVVSNPPYVKQEEIVNLDKNVKEYEPLIALTPFDDPLVFYKRMISISDKILKKGGRLYWEIHEDLGKETLDLFIGSSFQNCKLHEDMYGRDRFISAQYLP
jgi:release factor glutamine methyltransferase